MILCFSFFSNENTTTPAHFLYLSVVYSTPVGYNDTIPDLTAKVIGKRIVYLTIAPASAFVELYTKHGLDTITVPIAASLILSAAALIP